VNLTNFVSDGYERKARLYPALLLIAPVVAAGVAMLSARLSVLQSLAAAIVGCGGAFLLTQLARDSGKNREKALSAKWGGLPSITIFRHRDPRLDSITKARYHNKLSALVKEVKPPTIEQEQSNPGAADAVYSAWSNFLRVNTRDSKKFALLFQENINYGYRRNVWGLKRLGIVACVLSAAACGARLWQVRQTTGRLDEALGAAGIFAVVLLLLWLFRFTPRWVRVPADAYAHRLAESAEILSGHPPAERAGTK
jgi:hypothetical protein